MLGGLALLVALSLPGCGSKPAPPAPSEAPSEARTAPEGASADVVQQQIWDRTFAVRWSDGDAAFLSSEGDGTRLELKLLRHVQPEHAEAIIADKIGMFESVFREFRTGYPGQVTRYIECPERFRPQYAERAVEGGLLRYFTGFANANFVAGACAEDLVRYRMLHGHLYCDSQTMVDVDFFSEPDDSGAVENLLNRIDCEL